MCNFNNFEAILTDTRDNKKYWVTKLKDGNCWMTQNLDYDIPGKTKTGTFSTTSCGDGPVAADPGNYVLTKPLSMQSCSPNSSIAKCADIITDVTGKTASTNPIFEFTSNQDSVVSGNTYDAHFHIGNYYDNAATASVCPTGWLAPTTDTTNNGSYVYLMSSYGLTNNVANAPYDARKHPLYYIYSGRQAESLGTKAAYLGTSNKTGRIVTECGGSFARILTMENTSLAHLDNGMTNLTFSIRCVFRGQ